MPRAARHIGWCFTLNNPTNDESDAIRNLQFEYLIIGEEIGESGTPHLQGYIHYKIPRTFLSVKKDLGRAHVEQRKGTPQQAADYCKKEEKYVEYGKLPKSNAERAKLGGQATKRKYKAILEAAKSGRMEWIQDEHPDVWINLSHRLQSLRETKATILDDIEHEWWVGETGTGKSKHLWELYPNHFQKELNKWWDGYQYNDVVAIEEWSPKNECTGSQLKIWADRYPFTGQIKGGALLKIRPKKIIVLSNYNIQDCFPDCRNQHPLLRRFKVLRFPDDIPIAIENAAAFNLKITTVSPEPDPDASSALSSMECEPDLEFPPPLEDMFSFLDDCSTLSE